MGRGETCCGQSLLSLEDHGAPKRKALNVTVKTGFKRRKRSGLELQI